MDKFTEELLNGIQLILKYQPNATYDLEESYGSFIFGVVNFDISDQDKLLLKEWNWTVYFTFDGTAKWRHY